MLELLYSWAVLNVHILDFVFSPLGAVLALLLIWWGAAPANADESDSFDTPDKNQ